MHYGSGAGANFLGNNAASNMENARFFVVDKLCQILSVSGAGTGMESKLFQSRNRNKSLLLHNTEIVLPYPSVFSWLI
jgi:hypothetical protein